MLYTPLCGRAAGSIAYRESRKAQMKEVPQWCKLPGSYRVTFTAAHAPWINNPLVWEFKVGGGTCAGG